MILTDKDITSEFAENFLDKLHLAMSKIDPNWMSEVMESSDSTEVVSKIAKLKIQGYKWILSSSGKGFDDKAKRKLSQELKKLGEETIQLFILPSTIDELNNERKSEELIQKSKLPSQAQLDAGNYRKKHIRINGFDIAIENKKNSYRSGVDKTGKSWKCKIYFDYGYIKGTIGADGDHVDVFIGPNPKSEIIFIINQIDPNTKDFDEHKVMMGFSSEDEAKTAYLKNYEKYWKGLGSIISLTLDQFREWLEKGSQKKELVNPKLEFLKADLERIIKRNNEEISIIKSHLAIQPVVVHGKNGNYIQMRKVKIDNDFPSSHGFQLQSEKYKKPKIRSFQEKPKYKIKPEDSLVSNLVTNIKDSLLRNGQHQKAKEFTDLAFIAQTVDDIYEIANDFVELQGNRAKHRKTENDEQDLFKAIDYGKLQPKKIINKLRRFTTVYVKKIPFISEKTKKQSQEYKSVIRKYKKTPLWMKAPNGDPTTLSTKEWIKSKTQSFKAKYGDWEGLALKEYFEQAEPVMECKNEVPVGLGIQGTVDWFNKAIGSQLATHRISGGESIQVEINGRGIKNSLSKGVYPKKFQSILAIQSVIEKGRLIDVSLDSTRYKTINYHFVAPVKIKSIKYPMIVRVVSDKNGDRFYLHEIVLINNKWDSSQTQPSTIVSSEQGESHLSNSTIFDREKKVNKKGIDSFQSPAKLQRSKLQTESIPTPTRLDDNKFFVNRKNDKSKHSTYRETLDALHIDPSKIKIKLKENGEPDMSLNSIIKSAIILTKSQIRNESIDILKGGKRRKDGETWTQPSGRKVTKKNGKIIPVFEKKSKNLNDSKLSKTKSNQNGTFTATIKDGYDVSKLFVGKRIKKGDKTYEVVSAPSKNKQGKYEATFKMISLGGEIGSLPDKAIQESKVGGFAKTTEDISKLVNNAVKLKKKELLAKTNTKTEKGISVPTSLPFGSIKRAEQYTAEKDFDKDTINSLKERILENGYDPSFPIMVDKQNGVWTVVAGHHRHVAVQQLIEEGKLPTNFQIPVVTKEFASDNDRIAAQVSENQRRNVLPTDEAKAYGKMQKNGWDAKKIAEKLGKKPGDVNKRLALNNLESNLFALVKSKDRSLPLGVAEVLGMFGKDVNGNPSHTIQLKAFKWYVENRSKYPGRGPSVVQSYIKDLQSGDLAGMDFDSVASDAQKEALRTIGSQEKALSNKKMIDGMLDSLMKSYQRILGDNIGEINPQTVKELAASLTLSGGTVGGSPVLGKLEAVIQDLSLIKDKISQKMKEIEADSQTPMMFGFAKSILVKTNSLINLFEEEKDKLLDVIKGKVA